MVPTKNLIRCLSYFWVDFIKSLVTLAHKFFMKVTILKVNWVRRPYINCFTLAYLLTLVRIW